MTDELCATCAHPQHESDQCKARYHVTFEKGEAGDPCLCTHQAWWDKRRSPPDDPNRRTAA